MTDTPVTELSDSVENLKQKWANLNVVDRAAAVKSLHDPPQKLSFRTLAKELGCSLTHVRDLYIAASAPIVDRLLARQGKISTRELIRRGRAAKAAAEAELRTSTEAKRAKEAEAGSKLICKWIEQQDFSGTYGETIVDEARRMLAMEERNGSLPNWSVPKDTPVTQIIECARPKPSPGPQLLEVDSDEWYAVWLASWTLVAFPDSSMRNNALGLALKIQIRRQWEDPRPHHQRSCR